MTLRVTSFHEMEEDRDRGPVFCHQDRGESNHHLLEKFTLLNTHHASSCSQSPTNCFEDHVSLAMNLSGIVRKMKAGDKLHLIQVDYRQP